MSNYPYKKKFTEPFKPSADSGNLHASVTKKGEFSPDYFGEIAINMDDKTAIRFEDGLTIIKISGWKRRNDSGKTYLALKVNRYVPEAQSAPVKNDLPDDDLDF